MKIIGLGHYSRTGKDTIANYTVDIIRELDPTLRVAKIPFATKLKQIAHELKLDDGYRLVINNGAHAGQTVFHVHLHLLGGRHFGWPPG